MAKTMASLKGFVSQHPHLTTKIVVGITVLAIALLADPATAKRITETQGFPQLNSGYKFI